MLGGGSVGLSVMSALLNHSPCSRSSPKSAEARRSGLMSATPTVWKRNGTRQSGRGSVAPLCASLTGASAFRWTPGRGGNLALLRLLWSLCVALRSEGPLIRRPLATLTLFLIAALTLFALPDYCAHVLG